MLSFSPIWFLLSLLLSTVIAQTQGLGDLFVFVPGLGACGFTNTSQQIVATVSSTVFDSFPNATANPNKNPICKHKAFIKRSKNVTAPIVDFFPSTSKTNNNIGLSSAGFTKFASLDDGIVSNVVWSIV